MLEMNIDEIAERHSVLPFFRPGLQILQRVIDDKRSFIFIIDCSGSMNEFLPGKKKRRWDELIERIEGSLNLLCCYSDFTAEIYLFHEHLMTFTSRSQLESLISRLRSITPSGGTPMCQTLQKLFANHPHGNFVICSDGEATDDIDTSSRSVKYFETKIFQILNNRPLSIFISWWICSDDQRFVEYLSYMDDHIPNLDLVDDFDSECQRCIKYRLTLGSYYVKSLVAPFLPFLDNIDTTNVINYELPPSYENSVVSRERKTTLVLPDPKQSSGVVSVTNYNSRCPSAVSRVDEKGCCIIL